MPRDFAEIIADAQFCGAIIEIDGHQHECMLPTGAHAGLHECMNPDCDIYWQTDEGADRDAQRDDERSRITQGGDVDGR